MDIQVRQRNNELTLTAFLATVTMLFAAFTAAYLIRRVDVRWHTVELPIVFWINTVVLVCASAAVELAKRRTDVRWTRAALALGCLFLVGQTLGWKVLSDSGVMLAGEPHAAFLYLLSAIHALHVVGGVIALAVLAIRGSSVRLTAGYWHFMTGVWMWVLAVLIAL